MKNMIDPQTGASLRNRLSDKYQDMSMHTTSRAYIYNELVGLSSTTPDRIFASTRAELLLDSKSK